MSGLTTHALDLVSGLPAAGMTVELFARSAPKGGGQEEAGSRLLKRLVTNQDGRTDEPFLGPDDMKTGAYRLVFHLGAYNRAMGRPEGLFDLVPVNFVIHDTADHYHVPLLATPFGYSTYRGS